MSGSRGVKSFVSEAEAEEVRQKRQEEWEKVRQPDDPLERPEEVNDTRTLYEKLQEQKDKKQEEWEEQHKFKNMIRGLESEETEFLDLVAKQQHEVNKRRYDEQDKELKGFRSAVSELQDASVAKQTVKKQVQVPGKKSQMDLIAGGIKRRKSSSSSDTTPEKKPKIKEKKNTSDNQTDAQSNPTTSTDNASLPTYSSSDEEEKSECHRKVYVPRCRVDRRGANLRQSLTIPGMGIYSDSSDSESSSSDSEIITTSSFVRYQ